MKIETYIDSLVSYAMNCGLTEPEDHIVVTNRILDLLRLDDYAPSDELLTEDLEEILKGILDYTVEKGLCDDGITARDIFDTRIMGAITPMPREVIRTFREKYAKNPVEATDWYYKFSCDTDYIRRYRIAKDMRWKYASEYGEMDITINLSKPEKDPKAIAAAKNAPQTAYPKCQLCRENEGYAGRMNHPARANHRIVPIQVCGAEWCLQYSPYVYYNEHCIVFNSQHIPMKIDKSAFEKLLDFVRVFKQSAAPYAQDIYAHILRRSYKSSDLLVALLGGERIARNPVAAAAEYRFAVDYNLEAEEIPVTCTGFARLGFLCRGERLFVVLTALFVL